MIIFPSTIDEPFPVKESNIRDNYDQRMYHAVTYTAFNQISALINFHTTQIEQGGIAEFYAAQQSLACLFPVIERIPVKTVDNIAHEVPQVEPEYDQGAAYNYI